MPLMHHFKKYILNTAKMPCGWGWAKHDPYGNVQILLIIQPFINFYFLSKDINFKKLNYVEVTEQYQIKMQNRFAALGNLYNNMDIIRRTWESIRQNISTSANRSQSSTKNGLTKIAQNY
jgi:hypothetical protein